MATDGYLAIVIDLYSRLVVGWAMSERMTAQLVCDALQIMCETYRTLSHTLKIEAIHGERFATRELMRHTVFEYIEVDYIQTRRHSDNGYISPQAFEAFQVV